MNKAPDLLATHTISLIICDIIERSKEKNLTSKEVFELMSRNIKKSYGHVLTEDKNAFYQALSFRLQSDKFKSFYPKLYEYLQVLELADKPRDILNNIHKKFHDRKQFFNNITKSKVLRPLFEYVLENPLTEQLVRYIQPFNFIAKSIYLIVLIPLIIAISVGVAAMRGVNLVLRLWDLFIDKLSYLVVGEQYAKELNKYIDSEYAQYKKEYLVTLRDEYIAKVIWSEQKFDLQEIKAIDDQYFFESTLQGELNDVFNGLYKDPPSDSLGEEEQRCWNEDKERRRLEILEEHNKKIISSIPVHGLGRLKRLFMSFYNAITAPMDNFGVKQAFSLLVIRPLQLIAAPLILLAAAVGEVAKYATFGASILGMAAIVSVCFITLSLLSGPLYLYDFARYSLTKVRNYINSDKTTEATTPILFEQPIHQLMNDQVVANKSLSDEVMDLPPTHYHSPLQKFNCLDKNDCQSNSIPAYSCNL